jgi:predicted NAD/FAD-binding protein
MRALDGGFHINLKKMYDYLGVGYITQKFLYSLSSHTVEGKKPRPYFLHSSSNHRLPPIRPAGSGYMEWIMQTIYLTVCYFWFTLCCFVVKPKLASSSTSEETLRVYLKRIRLPRRFVKDYMLPLMSSVTTCSHDALLDFPARDAIEYAKKTYRQPHYTVIGGVQEVQSKLSKELVINLGATVTSVKSIGAQVQLTWTDFSEKHRSSDFDHVIMAVTPDVVAALFEPLCELMHAIPVVRGEVVVHHDTSTIADCSQSLEKFNTKAQESHEQPQIMHISSDSSSTEATHEQSSLLVTSFPISPIDPDKVFHRTRLVRVLRTPQSREIVNDIFTQGQSERALPRKEPLWRNGDGNVWLVGAWCWDGMVLLEGCVVSAMRVATSLRVEVPWETDQLSPEAPVPGVGKGNLEA